MIQNQQQPTSEVSSTPLSSSIPSPDTSIINIPKTTTTTTTENNGIGNTVSTSTSGLFDYVTSSKLRHIKEFKEKHLTYTNDQRMKNGFIKANSVLNDQEFTKENRTSRLKSNEKLNSGNGSMASHNGTNLLILLKKTLFNTYFWLMDQI